MKRINFARVLFVVSLCLGALGYGILAGRYQLFPYRTLLEAKYGLIVLRNFLTGEIPTSAGTDSNQQLAAPIAREFGRAGSELILVSGGKNYMQPHSTKQGCLAWLMDRQGTVKHVWQYDENLWNDLRDSIRLPGYEIEPIGVHLYANGDLLVSYQGGGSFPYGLGVARFDRDSNLLWKKELHSHHWFTVGEDGRIYIPAQHTEPGPYAIGKSASKLIPREARLLLDTVMVLDPDGNVLEDISVIDSLIDSGWVGLFQGAAMRETRGDTCLDVDTWDPLHLNDVRLVTDAVARSNPQLNAGDLLVSFRSLNAVGILDGQSKTFKWVSAGTTLRQHSPRFWNDKVVIFDNLGGQDQGTSRLVAIDIATGRPEVILPRKGVPLPGRLDSYDQGHLDIHADGRRALVAITRAGEVWEVDLTTGEVLWQYVYTHPQEPGPTQVMRTAKYAENLAFPLNCEEPTP
ncbi:MAG: arylsulfotransferase family protein [Planctomycetaceae bacterium]